MTLEIPLTLAWGVHLSPLQCTARVTLTVELTKPNGPVDAYWNIISVQLPGIYYNEGRPAAIAFPVHDALATLLAAMGLVRGAPVLHPDILRATD